FARSHLDRTKMIKEDKGPDGLKGRRRDGATNLETVSFDGMEGGMERRDFAVAGEYEGIHARSRLNSSRAIPAFHISGNTDNIEQTIQHSRNEGGHSHGRSSAVPGYRRRLRQFRMG